MTILLVACIASLAILIFDISQHLEQLLQVCSRASASLAAIERFCCASPDHKKSEDEAPLNAHDGQHQDEGTG